MRLMAGNLVMLLVVGLSRIMVDTRYFIRGCVKVT